MRITNLRIAIALSAIRGKVVDPYRDDFPPHMFVNEILRQLKFFKDETLELYGAMKPEVETATGDERDFWWEARKQVGKYAINPAWWPSEYDHLFTK